MEVSSCDISSNCPKFTAESYINFKGDGYHAEISAAALRLNRIFIKPMDVKQLADGVTAYSSGIIIIAGTKHPYWIPVTVGELFELQLNYYELQYKFNKQEGDLYVLDEIKQEKQPIHLTNSNSLLIVTTSIFHPSQGLRTGINICSLIRITSTNPCREPLYKYFQCIRLQKL